MGTPKREPPGNTFRRNHGTIHQSKSHRWGCKYHIVFIPKYRRKVIFGQIRKELGGIFRKLAEQKECVLEEGHIMPNHVP